MVMGEESDSDHSSKKNSSSKGSSEELEYYFNDYVQDICHSS